MPKIIEVRKLAAVDMVWLGTQVVVVEYVLGVALPLALGILSLRAGFAVPGHSFWQVCLGIWLVTISINYIPLLFFAVSMARSGTVEAIGTPELTQARRYGIQQVIILVPLLVVILAVIQEQRRRNAPPS